MALSIGVSVGSQILVGTETVNVIEVNRTLCIKVRVKDKIYTLTDMERIEIFPQVFFSCGASSGRASSTFSRIAVEAPKHILVRRIGAPT